MLANSVLLLSLGVFGGSLLLRWVQAEAGAVDEAEPLADAEDPAGETRAQALAERMNAIAEETERGWTGRSEGGGLLLTREVRGVKQAVILDAGLLGSAEARRLDEHARPTEHGGCDLGLSRAVASDRVQVHARLDHLGGDQRHA